MFNHFRLKHRELKVQCQEEEQIFTTEIHSVDPVSSAHVMSVSLSRALPIVIVHYTQPARNW